MTGPIQNAYAIMIRKLDRLADLDEQDRDAIQALPMTIRSAPAGEMLVREGHRAVNCCLLIEGYANRHKMTSNGERQIVSFHLPGDILNLQHLLLAKADHNAQALTEVTVAWIPAEAMKELSQSHARIGEALWRDTLIDASIFREWVLNVGRRDARSRVAHMLCEFAVRRNAAGLGAPERFELPMTQEQIADATGLTPVHVNRMLQALGLDGVIERDRRRITIADWERLRREADFDPAYLHAAA